MVATFETKAYFEEMKSSEFVQIFFVTSDVLCNCSWAPQ